MLDFEYVIKNNKLERPEFVKDLGVIFDGKLNFNKHVDSTVTKSMKSLGFIVRNSKEIKDINALKSLFSAYVRAKLEYCSLVWNPIYKCNITALERVQRLFMKYLYHSIEGIYPPRGIPNNVLLNKTQLQTLESRRNSHSIIFLYKLVNGQIDCTEILSQITRNRSTVNVRLKHNFYLPTPRTNVLLSSPIYQMIANYSKYEDTINIFNCSLSKLRSILTENKT